MIARITTRQRNLLALLTLCVCAGCASTDPTGDPILAGLDAATPDARTFHEHVVTLANPFFEGRLPGSDGAERAEDYIAWNFERAGLRPAFGGDWFQRFTIPANKGFNQAVPRDAGPPIAARNVAGVLPGAGALAGQHIIIGAHHDHLGHGGVDARDASRDIHPGADDNASGVATVLMLAQRLASDSPSGDRRTIIFMTFTAEESGYQGSRHYIADPVAPIERCDLMINFDMVGRLRNGRVSVETSTEDAPLDAIITGADTRSPLEVVSPPRPIAGSDHRAFADAGAPYVFVITTALHDDYHTTKDVSWKINASDGARLVDLFETVIRDAATATELTGR